MRSMRRSRIAATKKIMASLANSDGCTPMPAMPNQRRAPLMRGPNSTAISASADQPERRPEHDRLPVIAVVDPHQDRHQHQPEQGERRLLEQEERGMLVLLHAR